MTVIGKDVACAAELLQAGKLVAIPTETVYGLAANALDASAIARIYTAKNRPVFNPLIVHCASAEQAFSLAEYIPDDALTLARQFWPGPLTIILKKTERIPDIVTAGNSWVGLRVPQHPVTLDLLKSLNFPLAAPSANPSGYVSPTRASHVLDGLNGKIDYILDGGECAVGVESTIVSFAEEPPALLRYGGVSEEKIRAIIPNLHVSVPVSEDAPLSPGQLASHYAPGKKVYLGKLPELIQQFSHRKFAVISMNTDFPGIEQSKQIRLSPSGSLEEAAKNIFSALRTLDKTDADCILAELMPETGIGRAINDRLRRAAV